MVLTLVIHRPLTSLAEIFDGFFHGMNKILQANSEETPDKSCFSGNKPLHEENDLRKIAHTDASEREFHGGGNFPPPLPCLDSCFSSQWESLAENSNHFA